MLSGACQRSRPEQKASSARRALAFGGVSVATVPIPENRRASGCSTAPKPYRRKRQKTPAEAGVQVEYGTRYLSPPFRRMTSLIHPPHGGMGGVSMTLQAEINPDSKQQNFCEWVSCPPIALAGFLRHGKNFRCYASWRIAPPSFWNQSSWRSLLWSTPITYSTRVGH